MSALRTQPSDAVPVRRTRVEAWLDLPPWRRFLLMSERPNELEREEAYRVETLCDLGRQLGRVITPLTAARVAEEDVEERVASLDEDYAMTLQEIADELGVSRVRVGQLIETALKKIRKTDWFVRGWE